MSEFRKGDLVIVHGRAITAYGEYKYGYKRVHTPSGYTDLRNIKSLFRSVNEPPWVGMIVGYSFLQTGRYQVDDYNEVAYLSAYQDHRVWLVVPIDTDQWRKPVACLADDIKRLPGETKHDQ